MLPDEHLLDGGYLSAEHLVNRKAQYGIDIIGPVRQDHSWQAKAGEGFDISSFQINWDQKFAIYPQGHASTKWQPDQGIHGKDVIKVRFLGKTCRDYPIRSLCTTSKNQPRELTFCPQELFAALNERRSVQNTKAFQQQYGARAGIESAHSQGVRRMGLRRTRYIGLAKTHLQHAFIAISLNLIHLDAWFNGIPLAQTRISRFKRELQPLAV